LRFMHGARRQAGKWKMCAVIGVSSAHVSWMLSAGDMRWREIYNA
jgi:hypothetical protein